VSALVIEFPLKSSEPAWWAVMGNNHQHIRTECKRGGSVSFAYHVGKPLTDRLWQDLTERFCVRQIRVYKHDQSQWTDAPSSCAWIHLDETGNVRDIQIAL
jgi:hypothetical protein